MIEQYLLAATAGAVATAMLALLLHKLHSARTLARFQSETNGRIHTLMQTNAQQRTLIDQGQQEIQKLESSIAQLRDDLAKQSKIAGEDRAAMEALVEDKENLLDHARRIAGEGVVQTDVTLETSSPFTSRAAPVFRVTSKPPFLNHAACGVVSTDPPSLRNQRSARPVATQPSRVPRVYDMSGPQERL